jgi:hypothetical protein
MDLVGWLRLHWDRAGAWACVAAGAIALIVGWVGVSGSGYPAAQLPYIISGGVGGVFLLGLGAMLWISADLRDEWVKLDDMGDRLDGVRDTIRDRGVLYVALVPPTAGLGGGEGADLQQPADLEVLPYEAQLPSGGQVAAAYVPGVGVLRTRADPTAASDINQEAGAGNGAQSGSAEPAPGRRGAKSRARSRRGTGRG